MKFINRFKLKRVLVISLLLISLFLVGSICLNNYYNKKNNIVINNYIGNVIESVKEKYPLVDEDELINILTDKRTDNNILEMYGLDLENDNVSLEIEGNYKKNIIINSVILVSISLIIVLIFLIDNYYKNKELKRIIKTIKKVNEGNYNLEISNNDEGDLALLKDELYKITLMLREKAEISIKDKEMLKDNISNISHQIKTPLTSMLIMIDNLIEGKMDEKKRKEFLFDVRSQIENINFLIIALLKLSRLDANVIEFKRTNINVKDMMFQVCKNVNALSNSKNINISLNGKSDITLFGDYNWELEAITNILKNCIEHTLNDKNIYISYEENYFYTKIVIEDEGKGISNKDMKHIFERFYKGEDSDTNSIGIGLALAKEIIEKDNGSISVKSKEGVGTKFIIKYFKLN